MKKALYILLLMSTVGGMRGQDLHFSQYNASPLTLNPALTGFFSGDYRVAGAFRSQWGSFTDSYRSIFTSFELNILKGKMKDDNLGLGLLFYNDKAGTIELGTNSLNFSLAYKKVFGLRVKHGLAVGFQTGIITQKLNTDKLTFDSQYNGIELDPDMATGETINGRSSLGIDFSAGALWQIVPGDNFNFYAGGAYYHISRPKVTFLENSSYSIHPKYVGHMGAYIQLNRLMNLLPSVVYYQQLHARQINAGSYLQFMLTDDLEFNTSFSVGAWVRIADPVVDAVILGARMDFRQFVVGMSYDVNISDLKVVSNSRGAYEISLIYTGDFYTKGKRNLSIPCPQL